MNKNKLHQALASRSSPGLSSQLIHLLSLIFHPKKAHKKTVNLAAIIHLQVFVNIIFNSVSQSIDIILLSDKVDINHFASIERRRRPSHMQ